MEQTAEQYEQIKARVIEEMKAERREKARQRQLINKASWEMFDKTEQEYLPKLVVKFSRRTGKYDCVYECKAKINELISSAIGIMGERNRKTVYLNGRAEEANTILRQLLDDILKD